MGLRKSLSNTIDKLKDRFLSGQKTGGYKAEGHRAWGHQYRELPFLTFQMIDYMRYDPTLILGLAMRKAPIADAELAYKEGSEWKPGIRCDDEETGLFIIKQIERFWSQDLHKALNNQIWGWVGGEVSYKLRNGDVEYKGLTMRHSADVTALELDNKFWGVKFKNVNQHGGTVNLKAGESLWFPHRPENGSYYGQTIFKGAYPPWCDKNLNGGAMDVRRLYMHKDAYGGAILYYPNTSMNIEGVGDVPARDIARQIVEQYAAGGVSSLPSAFDDTGKRLWEWDWRSTGAVPTHILEYPKDLDRELLRGIEIPDEVFMSGGAGSWEGKKVPERGYFSALNMDASAILTAFCKQVIEPLVLIKKGKPVDFDAQLKPFSVQLAELEASGDGKQSPTEPGGGKRHPSYQPEYSEKTNPFAMSLEKREYAAELAAAEIVGQAESIVEAASAAIEKRTGKAS